MNCYWLRVPATPIRNGKWNSQYKFRPLPWSRLYFYASVVQLENAVGHGEADTASPAFSGEVEVEDLFANIFRDAWTFVGDAKNGEATDIFFAGLVPSAVFECYAKDASLGHGLCAVLDDVE